MILDKSSLIDINKIIVNCFKVNNRSKIIGITR